MENEVKTEQKGFLSRNITLKWALILVLVVAAAGVFFWVSKSMECGRIAGAADKALKTSVSESADNTARAISIFASRPIIAQEWTRLQEGADAMVGSGDVTYAAIVDSDGVAVVHTDRSLRGKEFVEPEDETIAQASVPVMNFTKQVATVRVGVRYKHL